MGSSNSTCSANLKKCPSGTCDNPETSCRPKGDCYPVMKKVSQQTVRDLCMESYAGTWYPVARYNHPWETKCTTSSYVLKWDCYNNVMHMETNCFSNGTLIERHDDGILHIVCQEDRGKMMLEMPSMKKSETDEDKWPYYVHFCLYDKYAIVGGPSGQYLWVLSRVPYLPSEDINWIMKKVNYFGYCADQLVSTPSIVRPCKCSACSH